MEARRQTPGGKRVFLSTYLPVYLFTPRSILWLLPLTFLAIFFFLPLSKILFLTFNTSILTFENLQIAYHALRFTFYQAILSTLLTLVLGLPQPMSSRAMIFAANPFCVL